MNRLLGDLDYGSVYIDGIIILQKEDEPDEEHLREDQNCPWKTTIQEISSKSQEVFLYATGD